MMMRKNENMHLNHKAKPCALQKQKNKMINLHMNHKTLNYDSQGTKHKSNENITQ